MSSLGATFANAARQGPATANIQRARGFDDYGKTIPGAMNEITSEGIGRNSGPTVPDLLGGPWALGGRTRKAFPISLNVIHNMLRETLKVSDSTLLGNKYTRPDNASNLPQEFVDTVNKNFRQFDGFRDFDRDDMVMTTNTDSWRFASELIASYITYEAPATHSCAALALAVGISAAKDDLQLSQVLRASAHFHIFNQDGGFFENDPENASQARFTAATMSHYSVSSVREAYGATVEINVMYLTRPEVVVGAYYRLACAYWTKINEIQLRHLMNNSHVPRMRPDGARQSSNKYVSYMGILNSNTPGKSGIEELIRIVEATRPADAENEYSVYLVPPGAIPSEMINNTSLSQSLEIVGPKISGNLPLRYARMSNGTVLLECGKLADVEGRTVSSYIEYAPVPSGSHVGIHVKGLAGSFHRSTPDIPAGLTSYFPAGCSKAVLREEFKYSNEFSCNDFHCRTPFVVPPIGPDPYKKALEALCMRVDDDSQKLTYRWAEGKEHQTIPLSTHVRTAGSYAMMSLVAPHNLFLQSLSNAVLGQYATGYNSMEAADLYLTSLARFGPVQAAQDTFECDWKSDDVLKDIAKKQVTYTTEQVLEYVKNGEVAIIETPHETKHFIEKYWLQLEEIPKFIHDVNLALKGARDDANKISVTADAGLVAALSFAINREKFAFSSENGYASKVPDYDDTNRTVTMELFENQWRILLNEILSAYCVRIGAYPRNMSEAGLFAAAALIQNTESSWNKLNSHACPLPLDLLILHRRDLVGAPVIALVNNPDWSTGDKHKRSLSCVICTKQRNTISSEKFDGKPGADGTTIGNDIAAMLQMEGQGVNTTVRIVPNSISSMTVRFQIHIVASPERPPIRFDGALITRDLAATERVTPEDAGCLIEKYARWAETAYSVAIVPLPPGVQARDDADYKMYACTSDGIARTRTNTFGDANVIFDDEQQQEFLSQHLSDMIPWYVTFAIQQKEPFAHISHDGPVTEPYKNFEAAEYSRRLISGRITRAEHAVFDGTPLGPITAVKTCDMTRGGEISDVSKAFYSIENLRSDARTMFDRVDVHETIRNRSDKQDAPYAFKEPAFTEGSTKWYSS